ncbi:MAG: sulfatase-like hydrolase/transferase [Spirochaetota bacterium]
MAKDPNIVVVVTDDQGAWAMGCAGNTELRTPTLDRLAAEGTRFDSFFCVSPVCSPARASILTGRIPSQHGVHDWLRAGNSTCEPEQGGKLVEYLAGFEGYTDHLARAGYVCGMSGKWHMGDCHHAQKSYTFWKAHARAGGSYMKAPMVKDEREIELTDRYVTDVITDNAIDFLEQVAGGSTPATGDDAAPFCLSVNYTAPHSPWEREEHPADVFNDYYDNCAFASVPDNAPHPWDRGRTDFFSSPERRREKLAGYFAATTCMDAGVGRIVSWLEEHGLAEDTLVLFTSDNGMNMGHHGICGKGNGTWPINMYDTSVKVPFIAWQPGTVPAGRVETGLYSQYDVLPTILDWAGVGKLDDSSLPGSSLAPVLRGEVADGASAAAASQNDAVVVYAPESAQSEYGPVRMIRTTRRKYVHRYPGGPHEYYDLENDPDETSNLFNDAAFHDEIAEMRSRLEAWFVDYVDPVMDGATKAVSGQGQLDLATLAQEGDVPFAQLWMKSWW